MPPNLLAHYVICGNPRYGKPLKQRGFLSRSGEHSSRSRCQQDSVFAGIIEVSRAIHLTRLEGPDIKEHEGRLRRQWRDEVERPARKAGLNPPKLVISPSPYRSFIGRLLKHISEMEKQRPGCPIAVVIPELVKEHWWDYLLHSSRPRQLRAALLRHGGPNLVVVMVPWAREEPHPEK